MGFAAVISAGVVAVSLAAAAPPAAPPPSQPTVLWTGRDLTQLSLSELAATKVTAVSRKPEERSKTAAAIQVLTSDDIRRSGATSIPELLRLTPGVHVGRIHSNQWAIGVRGFTSRLARSQLALMDGRSLYTTLFAGTYWEVQDTLLEDVERIEIVRGPGGTLWGANAVTGIINVVTKNAAETTGGLFAAGGGTEERAFARARYGGRLGTGHFRVWGKYLDRDAVFHEDGSGFDDWRVGRGGFRADWQNERESLTVLGGGYSARLGSRSTVTSFTAPFSRTVDGRSPASGAHVLARWSRSLGKDGEMAVQVYYDRTSRTEPSFAEDRDTGDVDAQYRVRLGPRNELVTGIGYRVSNGRSRGTEALGFVPPDHVDHVLTGFVQDDFALVPERLSLTVGTKLEQNEDSGFELQPTVRLGWSPTEPLFVWGAVTRAVRTPSRIERDFIAAGSLDPSRPLFFRLSGNPDFETETMLSYEAGFRARVSERLFVDLAAFHSRAPNLLSLEAGAPIVEPGRQYLSHLMISNGTEGEVSGAELAADLRLSPGWLIRSGYTFLNMDLRPRPGSTDTTTSATEDASPRHRVYLWSSLDLGHGLSLDARGRWVARLPSQRVDAYATMDARLGWRAARRWELAVVGQNLLDARHAEFGGAVAGEIERSVYGEVTWQW